MNNGVDRSSQRALFLELFFSEYVVLLSILYLPLTSVVKSKTFFIRNSCLTFINSGRYEKSCILKYTLICFCLFVSFAFKTTLGFVGFSVNITKTETGNRTLSN